MLGDEISDPDHVESQTASVRGIGLLPVRTVLARDKTTRTVRAETPSGISFNAYEIHMGVTEIKTPAAPFAALDEGTVDGIRLPNAIGTYLHGAFENRAVLEELIGSPVKGTPSSKETQYDRMADWFAENANLAMFFRLYTKKSE